MLKNLISINFVIILLVLPFNSFANNLGFESWLTNFKKEAITSGISKNVVDDVTSDWPHGLRERNLSLPERFETPKWFATCRATN